MGLDIFKEHKNLSQNTAWFFCVSSELHGNTDYKIRRNANCDACRTQFKVFSDSNTVCVLNLMCAVPSAHCTRTTTLYCSMRFEENNERLHVVQRLTIRNVCSLSLGKQQLRQNTFGGESRTFVIHCPHCTLPATKERYINTLYLFRKPTTLALAFLYVLVCNKNFCVVSQAKAIPHIIAFNIEHKLTTFESGVLGFVETKVSINLFCHKVIPIFVDDIFKSRIKSHLERTRDLLIAITNNILVSFMYSTLFHEELIFHLI